jgi:AcrR family transcriptional regulator
MSTRTASRRAARPKPAPRRPAKAAERRQPQQDRGQKRFEELLDAAELVIAEVGVDAMTTNAVAARAGAGMGSLYHFFANRDAIVTALAERYVRTMRPLTEYAGRPELFKMPLADLADAIVDPLAEFFRNAPAYRHVWHAVNQPGSSSVFECQLQESVIESVLAMMAARVPGGNPKRLRVHAATAVELVHGMLSAAFAAPVARRQPLIDETKRLLTLYSEMIQKGDDPLVRLR